MIGKRVAWDSNFTIKSLEKEGMGKEHDPFIIFPFIHLKGMRMVDIDNLICPPCNSPRGLREILVCKQEPLQSSLIEGWWVHSWLIPLLDGMYFDRRHTIKTIQQLIRERKINAKYIPVADYERVCIDHEPWAALISSFDTVSIIMMLAMLANVLKGDDDAKSDHFFNTIVDIINKEDKIRGEDTCPELKSKEFIRKLLDYMGAYRRYSDARGSVSTTLTNRIWDHFHVKAQPSAGQLTMNVEEENRNKFINDSDDWMDGCWNNNETDDEYMYRVYALNNIEDHHRTIYQKISQWIYQLDNEARNKPTVTQEILEPKTLKVLLWCKKTNKFDAAHAPNVIASREYFKKHFRKYFYDTRDSVTSKFQDVLPKNYEENCKHPSDYKLEIHFMPQIEDVEDNDKSILWEDMDLPSEFDNLNEEFRT